MTDEQMLTEGREAGKEYVNRFKGDWKALAADLNRRTVEEGRPLYIAQPSPVTRPATPHNEPGEKNRPVPI
jgi:hypothetical protein